MTVRAAVIGSPVSHSLSPAIFSFLARGRGVGDFEYGAIEVEPEKLREFIAGARQSGDYLGVNVTLPHKEAVRAVLDECTSEAAAMGAVNVVRISGGRLSGFNTDIVGIQKTFEGKAFSPAGKAALILGAGGSARAVTHALGAAGASQVFIWNPRPEPAAELASRMRELFPSTRWTAVGDYETLRTEFALLVNTTPVGMKGVDRSHAGVLASAFYLGIEKLAFAKGALAFDLIYNPEETPFLRVAAKIGLATVGGLEMLVEQAFATWRIWRGDGDFSAEEKARLTAHLRGLLAGRSYAHPIFLTGFMGVGKSSVGHHLAKVMGRTFLDTDRMIEEGASRKVSEIFATKGEPEFRRLEKLAVHQAARSEAAVVALGGGALTDPETAREVARLGTVIYLRAGVESIRARLEREAPFRPLLAGLGAVERDAKIAALLAEREPVYRQSSATVETDGKSIADVADAIIEGLPAALAKGSG